MNILDVVIGAVCLAFFVHGLVRGLVDQLFSWCGLILGHVLGVRYCEAARGALHLGFRYADAAAYAGIFIAVYVGLRLAGLFVERHVRGSKLSWADRLGGGIAGLAKGALASVLLVFLLVIILPRDARALARSRLAPHARVAAAWVVKVIPERVGAMYREKAEPPHPKNPPRK